MNLEVSHHISQCSKHMQKHHKFQIIQIYKIKKDDTNLPRQMESYFINLLMPDFNQKIFLARNPNVLSEKAIRGPLISTVLFCLNLCVTLCIHVCFCKISDHFLQIL